MIIQKLILFRSAIAFKIRYIKDYLNFGLKFNNKNIYLPIYFVTEKKPIIIIHEKKIRTPLNGPNKI
jgi:hypothetical protein